MGQRNKRYVDECLFLSNFEFRNDLNKYFKHSLIFHSLHKFLVLNKPFLQLFP